jgi:hypothetical protein
MAKAKEEKKTIKLSKNKQKKKLDRATQKKAENDHELALAQARQKWACVWLRNKHITRAIKQDFTQRQETLARKMQHRNEYDGSVDVIPVSATAFRDHLKGREPM